MRKILTALMLAAAVFGATAPVASAGIPNVPVGRCGIDLDLQTFTIYPGLKRAAIADTYVKCNLPVITLGVPRVTRNGGTEFVAGGSSCAVAAFQVCHMNTAFTRPTGTPREYIYTARLFIYGTPPFVWVPGDSAGFGSDFSIFHCDGYGTAGLLCTYTRYFTL